MKYLFPILAVFGMTTFTSCLKNYKCTCSIYAPPNNVAPAIEVTMTTQYNMVSSKKAKNNCREEEEKHRKAAQPSTTVDCTTE